MHVPNIYCWNECPLSDFPFSFCLLLIFSPLSCVFMHTLHTGQDSCVSLALVCVSQPCQHVGGGRAAGCKMKATEGGWSCVFWTAQTSPGLLDSSLQTDTRQGPSRVLLQQRSWYSSQKHCPCKLNTAKMSHRFCLFLLDSEIPT